jgi:hypothetical protein
MTYEELFEAAASGDARTVTIGMAAEGKHRATLDDLEHIKIVATDAIEAIQSGRVPTTSALAAAAGRAIQNAAKLEVYCDTLAALVEEAAKADNLEG